MTIYDHCLTASLAAGDAIIIGASSLDHLSANLASLGPPSPAPAAAAAAPGPVAPVAPASGGGGGAELPAGVLAAVEEAWAACRRDCPSYGCSGPAP
jgi:hypothetical protein